MKKVLLNAAAGALMVVALTGCDGTLTNSSTVDNSNSTLSESTSTITAKEVDLSKNIEIKMNLSYGNSARTMTYNQSTPLVLSDQTTITSGHLKPMWQAVGTKANVTFNDTTVQDQKASDMITTQSSTNFNTANIYGGSSIAEELMYYGTQGKFASLTDLMNEGYLSNFRSYLEENPSIASSITAYDGEIYHIPYIAEIGTFARAFHMREEWVTSLLDGTTTTMDTSAYNTSYSGYYTAGNNNLRTSVNGGTVTPKKDVNIVKATNQSIIEIQNALSVKNGQTLTNALVNYIDANYSYTNPSELYLGANAAYDIDELVALFRCIKANPSYLTDGKASVVYPYFTRQSSYREEIIRLATYFGGVKVNGSDSYGARWFIDNDGQIQYTYSREDLYDVLTYLSQIQNEGLIYNDCYDLTNKANMRSKLYGSDTSANPAYGFMTYDFIASTTADSLNSDIVVTLPPVAKVNNVWQYYIDNTRVIKPDGWAISAASTEEEIIRCSYIMDYFFTDEGYILQNYGLPMDIQKDATITGPDGIVYPAYTEWTAQAANQYAKGDLSTFLRDYMGCQMPIGYQKEIGFEYQYTSERGFDGWKLLTESTCGMPSYAGTGLAGSNSNYYKLIPPIFSLTSRQKELLIDTKLNEYAYEEVLFNVIRYKTTGGAPEGTVVLNTYADYLDYFNKGGLATYVSVYQSSYAAMVG